MDEGASNRGRGRLQNKDSLKVDESHMMSSVHSHLLLALRPVLNLFTTGFSEGLCELLAQKLPEAII